MTSPKLLLSSLTTNLHARADLVKRFNFNHFNPDPLYIFKVWLAFNEKKGILTLIDKIHETQVELLR